jgi:hypothetical protein
MYLFVVFVLLFYDPENCYEHTLAWPPPSSPWGSSLYTHSLNIFDDLSEEKEKGYHIDSYVPCI